MNETYSYPGYLRRSGILLIVLAAVIWITAGILVLTDPALSMGFFLPATAFFAAFGAFGRFIVRLHSARITLLQEEISVANGRKERRVRYDDILHVTYENIAFKSIVLHTAGGRLAVRENLIAYPGFIAGLKQKVKAFSQETAATLHIKCKAAELYFCTGVFFLISLGILVLAYIGLFQGSIDIWTAVFITVVLAPFAAFLLFASLSYPRYYDFESGRIVKTSLTGCKIFDLSEITKVEYGQRKPKSYSRFGSGISHFIQIDFADRKKYIIIDQSAANFPIDDIAGYVRKTYPVAGKFTEVRLQQKTDKRQ